MPQLLGRHDQRFGRVEQHFTESLDEHVALIERQLHRSLRDGESRRLAAKITSGVYEHAVDPRTGDVSAVVHAYGRNFLAPSLDLCRPHDHNCEIEAIWDFAVLNLRYVEDPHDIDTFATLRESLEMGAVDCDDATIALGVLLKALGFQVRARVISTSEAPNDWSHIYPLVGMPKNDPKRWIPLDMTVNGATPGWEYPDRARVKDYEL